MVAITSRPAFVAPRSRPRAAAEPAPLRVVPQHRPVATLTVDSLRRPWLSAVLAVAAVFAVAGLVLSEPLADPGTIPVADTHLVADGETMWSIAVDVAPAGEAAGYVERLVAINGTASVAAGQVVELPVP